MFKSSEMILLMNLLWVITTHVSTLLAAGWIAIIQRNSLPQTRIRWQRTQQSTQRDEDSMADGGKPYKRKGK